MRSICVPLKTCKSQKYGLKLPDAIIAATARKNDLTLLTADDHFKKLKSPWKVRFYKPI